MKKFLFLFGITFLMFGLAFNAHATSFDFSGSDAVLTINFEAETSLVVDDESPFTRWQNVRKDGEGSLKLTSIPDPATVFLLGSACLLGFAGARRKFKK